jgi:hypothetical protein
MSKTRYIILKRIRQKKEGNSASKSNVLPTERVKQICERIGLLGCVSLEQLHKAESPEITKQSLRDKMNDLVKAGLVKTKTVDAREKPETIFYLSRSARGLFTSDEWKKLQSELPAKSEQRSVLRTHDVLQKIQERFTVVSFVTEHQLKSEKSLSGNYYSGAQVADGRLTIQGRASSHDPVTFNIEVDGNYHGKTLRSKIASLGNSGQKVIWIAYGHTRVDRLADLCREFNNILPVHFENLNSLLHTL